MSGRRMGVVPIPPAGDDLLLQLNMSGRRMGVLPVSLPGMIYFIYK